jgi:hypothetical protein
MSSRTRMMGACNAGSTVYNSNVNLDTAGGDKKQGLPPFTNAPTPWANRAMQMRAWGDKRNVIFVMNQIGGVGRAKSQFKVGNGINNPDGVRNRGSYVYSS